MTQQLIALSPQISREITNELEKFPIRTLFNIEPLPPSDVNKDEISTVQLFPLSILMDYRGGDGAINYDGLVKHVVDEISTHLIIGELDYLTNKLEEVKSKMTHKSYDGNHLDLDTYFILANNDSMLHSLNAVDGDFHVYDNLPGDSVFLVPKDKRTGNLKLTPIKSVFITNPYLRELGYCSFEEVDLQITNPEEIICLSL